MWNEQDQIDGLVQDCNKSSASAMELLLSCDKPSKWPWWKLGDEDNAMLISNSIIKSQVYIVYAMMKDTKLSIF